MQHGGVFRMQTKVRQGTHTYKSEHAHKGKLQTRMHTNKTNMVGGAHHDPRQTHDEQKKRHKSHNNEANTYLTAKDQPNCMHRHVM